MKCENAHDDDDDDDVCQLKFLNNLYVHTSTYVHTSIYFCIRHLDTLSQVIRLHIHIHVYTWNNDLCTLILKFTEVEC